MTGWTQFLHANRPVDFLAALAIALAVWIVLALAKRYGGRFVVRMARRAEARWGDLLAGAVRATSLVLLTPVALYAGFSILDAPARLARLIEAVAVLALLAQAGLCANRLIVQQYEREMPPVQAVSPL